MINSELTALSTWSTNFMVSKRPPTAFSLMTIWGQLTQCFFIRVLDTVSHFLSEMLNYLPFSSLSTLCKEGDWASWCTRLHFFIVSFLPLFCLSGTWAQGESGRVIEKDITQHGHSDGRESRAIEVEIASSKDCNYGYHLQTDEWPAHHPLWHLDWAEGSERHGAQHGSPRGGTEDWIAMPKKHKVDNLERENAGNVRKYPIMINVKEKIDVNCTFKFVKRYQ